ncbi:unnamed protein product, partial [Larinioides sclopetarius]
LLEHRSYLLTCFLYSLFLLQDRQLSESSVKNSCAAEGKGEKKSR